jgi:2-polyprenyl-3-methyl-5-hydroxy-6-metoxy-1,4-benzoquinol methylase
MCYKILQLKHPHRSLKLLDIGCEDGRNSVFFARNGYKLLAFDISSKGIEKQRKWPVKLKYGYRVNYSHFIMTGKLNIVAGKYLTVNLLVFLVNTQ